MGIGVVNGDISMSPDIYHNPIREIYNLCPTKTFIKYLNDYKDELKKDFEMTTEVDMATYYDGSYQAVSNILLEFEERFRNE